MNQRTAAINQSRSLSSMSRLFGVLVSLAALAVVLPAAAQTKPNPATGMTPLEKRASLSIESVRNSPLELRNLLLKMPKGSDLHTHLYGAVYAETWIRNAAEDGMCRDTAA